LNVSRLTGLGTGDFFEWMCHKKQYKNKGEREEVRILFLFLFPTSKKKIYNFRATSRHWIFHKNVRNKWNYFVLVLSLNSIVCQKKFHSRFFVFFLSYSLNYINHHILAFSRFICRSWEFKMIYWVHVNSEWFISEISHSTENWINLLI
jgi:hypothetical protein